MTAQSPRKLLDSAQFQFRFDAGCPMPSQSVSIDDKEALTKSLAMNFVIYSQKAELNQIGDGFDCFNFSGLVRVHPSLLQPLFAASGQQSPTAAMLFHVDFSPQGSNR